jgi:hypothetical protein
MQLDGLLREYLDGGQYYVYQFKFQPPAVVVSNARPLPAADAHATRALLYAMMSGFGGDAVPRDRDELKMCARQELDQALREDADQTLALAAPPTSPPAASRSSRTACRPAWATGS